MARKIYNNVAIIPKFQEAPSDSLIEQRVARYFPRCSEMARTDPALLTKNRNLQVELSDPELDKSDDTKTSDDSPTNGSMNESWNGSWNSFKHPLSRISE